MAITLQISQASTISLGMTKAGVAFQPVENQNKQPGY